MSPKTFHRVEQVADTADALHVVQRQCLRGPEVEAFLEELVDAAVDAHHDVAAVDGPAALGCRALTLREPAVDAVPGGVHADGAITGVDRPVGHVAELRERPPEQLPVEVDERLRLRRMDLEVHDEVRHGNSLNDAPSRYAGRTASSRGLVGTGGGSKVDESADTPEIETARSLRAACSPPGS